ncbi:N-acetylglutamate synthase, CG3035 family [Mycolicibacter minnesotensis]
MVQPPELPEVGVRVSLRYLRPPGSTPPMGDMLGYLVETGPLVRIRAADGQIHQCRHADVLYVRRLTDRPVKNSAIRSVEHAAALGWPGSTHRWLDGWILRAGAGVDPAANSAVPLDMFAHANAVPAIIDWYSQRGLPPYLAVPERLLGLPETIPTLRETRTLVAEVTGGAAADEVVQADRPDSDWLALYGGHGPAEPAEVLTAVAGGEVVFVAIPGVAVGRGTVTTVPDGTRWLGLTALVVAPERRGQGHGARICATLQAWGAARGATRGFAQVPSGDPDAFAFFEAVGFAGQHRTRYVDARSLPHR